jgi:soluble cytochrome b562
VADGHEDPNVRELARSRLEFLKTGLASDQAVAQVNEAMRIANEGRLEEARDRLVALRGQPGAGAIRGDVERLIHELEAEARLRRAGKLIQGNQLAAAAPLLAGAGGSWPDSSYERRGRSALNEVRARRQIEQALALVKAGKLDEARAAFARVLEMDVAAPVKDYARQRVRDLDSARSRKP